MIDAASVSHDASSSLTALTDEALEDLVTLHQRIQRAYDTMLDHNADLAWERTADVRWIRLRQMYRDLIRQVVAVVTDEALTAYHDAVLVRLTTGWRYEPTSVENAERADRLFEHVVRQYEVTVDLMGGMDWVDTNLARMTRSIADTRCMRGRQSTGATP